MTPRADTLRHLIAFYHRRLHEGVRGAVAIAYLREIERAEAELEEIERQAGHPRELGVEAMKVVHPG